MKQFTKSEMESCTKAYSQGEQVSKNKGSRSENPYDRLTHESGCWIAGFEDNESLERRRVI